MDFNHNIHFYMGLYINQNLDREILLCVDESRENVEAYLKVIRRLPESQYLIRENEAEYHFLHSLFQRELMEEFLPGIIVPKRDAENILETIMEQDRQKTETVQNLTELAGIMRSAQRDAEARTLEQAREEILRSISKKKFRRDMERASVYSSHIFTCDILDYLTFIRIDQENQNLRNEYRMRLLLED